MIIWRLWKILRVIARYDLLWLFASTPRLRFWVRPLTCLVRRDKAALGRRRGENFCAALEALGPIFIKFGQVLSVRSDILGQEVADDLSRLQDKLPPFAGALAVASVEKALGDEIGNLFASFDVSAHNAASIAQVHKATTPEGDAVAVKILRPDIEKIFARDIKLLKKLARLLSFCGKEVRRLRLPEAVEMFERISTVETDLTLEAAAAAKMSANFAARSEKFYIPKVYWRYSHERILVTEWIDGYRIDDVQAIKKAGLSLDDIQLSAARIFFMQVFYDGFFHADMHPGNIFVRRDGVIVPVDFGIMGSVDERTLVFLADLLIGFFQGDYERVSDAHFDYGIVADEQSRYAFALSMRAIGEPLRGLSLSNISVAKLLAQLFRTTRKFNMRTQPQLLLLQKTIFMAEALGRGLNEEANMWVLARPLIEDWILLHHSPEARLWRMAGKFLRRLEEDK